MTAVGDLDRARIGELHAQELARFRQARPQSMAMGPTVCVPATSADVARYVSAYAGLLAELG